MKIKTKEIFILIILIILLFAINYNFLDEKLEDFLSQQEIVFVERVIDGDTVVTEIGNVRLLGINTPERGEVYYDEAKEFLEKEILSKNVTLEYVGEREDKYNRILAYIYFEGENINQKIVEQGFGNYYFYDGKDVYSDDLEEAWVSCIENEKNLCEKSRDVCGECVEIEGNKIVNSCSINCDINEWIIKGEGRNKFIFNGILEKRGEKEFELSLDNSGGSLFLRDSEGNLVLWKSY